MALDRERFVEEFLVALSFDCGHHENTFAKFILLWSTSSTEHLQDITDWVVNVSVLTPFIVLCTHDDD